jgi:drug/metabolite transporter superfamily protein YnfA
MIDTCFFLIELFRHESSWLVLKPKSLTLVVFGTFFIFLVAIVGVLRAGQEI